VTADVGQVGEVLGAELAQERDLGRLGEPVGRAALVVAVGVDDGQPFAGQQHGVGLLAVAAPQVVVVVAHHVVHGLAGADDRVVGVVHPGQAGPDVALHRVEEVVVGDAQARIHVVELVGRVAQVLAVQQQVVAGIDVVEHRVAVVGPVGVAAGDVVLLLRLPAVTPVVVVLGVVLLAEEVGRHVLDRIKPEAVRLRAVHKPAQLAEEQRVHILADRVAHVVAAVAIAPRRDLPLRPAGIEAGVGEGLTGLTRVVLAVGVDVLPVEAAVARGAADKRGGVVGVADVLERLLVGEGVDGEDGGVVGGRQRQVGVEVVLGIIGMPHPGPLRVIVVLVVAEAGVGRLVRDVLPERVAVQHLPLVAPGRPAVAGIGGVGQPLEVEILGHKPVGLQRAGQPARHGPAVVRHHVVEIDPQPEAVRHLHQVQQVGLRAVLGGDGAVLVLRAEIEAVVGVEAHRQPPARLKRRRQPQRRVARLGQLRHAPRNLVPAGVEVLEDHLARPGRGGQERRGQQARPF
jgi:hypothetical protein